MKYSTLVLFIFSSLASVSQENLSSSSIELIELSLQKSYSLKNANNDLMIDSIETRAIKQNFIPTLTMNGGYAYGAANINADIPTLSLPISVPKYLMENLNSMQRVILSMRT